MYVVMRKAIIHDYHLWVRESYLLLSFIYKRDKRFVDKSRSFVAINILGLISISKKTANKFLSKNYVVDIKLYVE
jgi:hypothetical protein